MLPEEINKRLLTQQLYIDGEPGYNQAADFSCADLCGCTQFKGCNLGGAVFSGADLEGVSFEGCCLDDVDFSYANLKGANLCNTTFSGTLFDGANVEGIIVLI